MITIQPNPYKANICILLTATIDPQGIVFLKRNNPIVRENDYIKSMKRWMEMQQFPIVFCENSGYKIDKIKNIIKKHKKTKIEILQFDGQCFPREFGKGYGEAMIINYAVKHSKIIKSSDYIIKVTGRYIVENIEKMAETLLGNSDIYVMADLKKNLTYADSRIFAFKSSFIVDYLSKFQNLLNDSKGFYLEHTLSRAILRAISDGHKWIPLPYKPIIIGYSGTSNTPYKRVSKIRWLVSEAIHKFKDYLNKKY